MAESIDPVRWHELKTDPDAFDALVRGDKTYEMRLNDRDFKVGDGLLLRRTKFTGNQMHMRPDHYPLGYTGEECRRIVSHIQTGYGLNDRWCILSFAALRTELSAPQAATYDSLINSVKMHTARELDAAIDAAIASTKPKGNTKEQSK